MRTRDQSSLIRNSTFIFSPILYFFNNLSWNNHLGICFSFANSSFSLYMYAQEVVQNFLTDMNEQARPCSCICSELEITEHYFDKRFTRKSSTLFCDPLCACEKGPTMFPSSKINYTYLTEPAKFHAVVSSLPTSSKASLPRYGNVVAFDLDSPGGAKLPSQDAGQLP
jgi:hypothetical protein